MILTTVEDYSEILKKKLENLFYPILCYEFEGIYRTRINSLLNTNCIVLILPGKPSQKRALLSRIAVI